MNLQNWSILIFLALIFLLFVMGTFVNQVFIAMGIILSPIFVILQVWVILTSAEQSEKAFEDQWYEH